jgi:zinc protease
MSGEPMAAGGSVGGLDRSRAPEPGPLRPFHFPAIETTVLENGLTVWFARTEGLPVVTLSVITGAGGMQEPDERAGLASLAAKLLESGAGGRDAEEIAAALETLGVHLSVGVSWEAASVELTALESRLEAAGAILSELVRQPTFPEDEVERLREEQLAGILQRRADPRGLANEAVLRYLYSPDSPYARPLGGTRATVEGLVRSDMVDFHATQFVPATTAVVIAGNIPAERAVRIARDGFGDWVAAPAPVRTAPVRPRSEQTQVVVVDRPGSVQSEIRVGHVGIARDHPDYFPVMVLNTILGGAFSSRLNLNLRERHGFTYGVHSSFSTRRQPGPFLVSTAVQTEVTGRAVAEIVSEVRRIREEPVAERELSDARNYLAGIFPLRLQTTEGVASRLAELAVYGLPADYFSDYRERILRVTGDEVLRAAREHLRPDHLAVVVVGDGAGIREPLDELGLAPAELVPAGGIE